MSTPTAARKLEYSEWLRLGEELYGKDKTKWEFACPSCKIAISFAKYLPRRDELKDLQPYAECVGRHLNNEGCDWAAYGLFCGPREIVDENDKHKAHVFYFAKEVRPL